MGGRSGLPDRAIFFWVCAWQDIDTYRWFITQIKGTKFPRAPTRKRELDWQLIWSFFSCVALVVDVLDEVQDLRIKHPQVWYFFFF